MYIQEVCCCDSSVLFALAAAGDGNSTTNAAMPTRSPDDMLKLNVWTSTDQCREKICVVWNWLLCAWSVDNVILYFSLDKFYHPRAAENSCEWLSCWSKSRPVLITVKNVNEPPLIKTGANKGWRLVGVGKSPRYPRLLIPCSAPRSYLASLQKYH